MSLYHWLLAYIGPILGVLLVLLLAALAGMLLPDLKTSVSTSGILLATTISALIGIFFGLYPARRASRLNPIVALRAN